MQLNKEYESEINLKDLFFYVLYRWRSILIVALIATALLGGYKYLSLRDVLSSGHSTQEEQTYESNLSSCRERVQALSNQLNDLHTYRNTSVYFQLNPQTIWTASCKYLVELDPSVWNQQPQGIYYDPTDSVLAAYTMPFSGISDDELTETFEVSKPEYAHELVEVITNATENTVTIRAKGPTKEYAEKGLEFLKSHMESAKKKAQRIKAHTLSLIGEETVINADKELLEKQSELNTAISIKGAMLSSEQLRLNELEVAGGPQNARKQLTKFIIIGFAAGAFLMIFLYIFRYVFLGKLTESKELSEQYNLPLLGEFSRSGSLHQNKGLDKLICRWELGKKVTDDDTVYDNIAAILNEKQEIHSILLISSLNTKRIVSTKENLSSRIQAKEIKAKGDFLTDSEAITEASKADAVILVEEKNKTARKDIQRMAETLTVSNANITGAIVL